ncbi:flippase [Winogradskyella sp. KYW1333]|uniref:flippase n=1 Tax=Winogradskyella sp. KYW1333 TaxID=2282123 RepID=UPI000DF2CFC3|nr:flippase [Winogradskyella sp. KYW1333]RCT55350.1 flippase [Winogradskyella sp. KYW1333]
MIKKITRLTNLDQNTSEVFKKSIPTAFVKILGMVLSILISIFLGRMLGADGLGVINLSNRIVAILLVVCLFGMRQVLIKEIAIGYSGNDNKRIGDSLKTAYFFNLILSISVSLILILLSPWLANNFFEVPELEMVLVISFIVFPFQILTRIFSSGLAGFRKIWQASLVDQTLSTFVTFLVLMIYYIIDVEITIINVIIAYVIGRFVATVVLGIYWNTIFSSTEKNERKTKELLKTAFPILLVTVTETIYKNVDIIMIGWLCSAKEVGIYTVASRIAIISGFLLNVAHSAVAPKVAVLYNDNKKEELQTLIQYLTGALFITALLILVISVVFSELILAIWGTEFKSGYLVLIILAIGQFFNVSTGTVGTILTMTGFEKKLLSVNTFFMILNLILNCIFINAWGIEGAAVAYMILIIGMNFTRVFYVYKFVGIRILPWDKVLNRLKL